MMKWEHAGRFSVQPQVHHMWGKNLDRTHIVILFKVKYLNQTSLSILACY